MYRQKIKSCNVIFLLTTVCRKPVQLPEFKNPWKEGEGVNSVHWSDAENDEMEVDVAVTTQRGPAGTLLVDSGAGYHLFHHEFATESSSKQSTGLKLRDVQGNTLSHHGTRLNLTVGTQGQRANI